MAKILSQDEIDALLTTVASGDVDVAEDTSDVDDLLRPVVAYDFKHPNRVSKDQIRTMESLHDNFAGHFGSSLSAMMRVVAEVELVSVDQITFSEFIMSLVSPSCTYTFTAEPLDGACVLDISPNLTFSFVERLFGGSGKEIDTERELTGIERTILAKIAKSLYTDLEKAWEHIVPIQVKQLSFESNPQFVQIVPPGETVVVVSFQLKLFKTSGLLSICYPYVSLEGIINKLSAQNWIDSTKKKLGEDDRFVNENNLLGVDAEIVATLGEAGLSVREFLGVHVGDIIPLNRLIHQPIDLTLAGRKKFRGAPGLSGKKKACQIVEILDDPQGEK